METHVPVALGLYLKFLNSGKKHEVWQDVSNLFSGLEYNFNRGKEFISGLSLIFVMIFLFIYFHFSSDTLLLQSMKIFIQGWSFCTHYLIKQLVLLFSLTIERFTRFTDLWFSILISRSGTGLFILTINPVFHSYSQWNNTQKWKIELFQIPNNFDLRIWFNLRNF